jgi:hypothetical protein
MKLSANRLIQRLTLIIFSMPSNRFFDIPQVAGLWVQMTKIGRSFDLPITQVHPEILAPLRELSYKWVLPSW